jgi:type I restriction enzyme, S subunit
MPEISEFLELYFIAPDGGRGEFEKVIYGAGRPHLSFDQLLNTRVPLPSISEMREIVRRVQDRQRSLLEDNEFLDVERDTFALRQSILKSAFEGRLVPQKENGEPASVLLSRMQAETSPRPAGPRRGRTAS